MLKSKKIIVITCGAFERENIRHVRHAIELAYQLETDLLECTMDVSEYYNPARRQYNADMLLKAMTARAPEGYLRYISLFKWDLYIPIMTYIFGQAQLNGRFGIASSFRLRNELYGLPESNALMVERFSKVVIHELGHTFGLVHCINPVCIMRSSTYVEDLDQKESGFCQHCAEKVWLHSDH